VRDTEKGRKKGEKRGWVTIGGTQKGKKKKGTATQGSKTQKKKGESCVRKEEECVVKLERARSTKQEGQTRRGGPGSTSEMRLKTDRAQEGSKVKTERKERRASSWKGTKTGRRRM